MAWTYQQLKDADAALGIDDPAQAAAALNAQTDTVLVDVSAADARAVLLITGEWFKVKQLAKQPLTGGPADQVIAAADICIDTLTLASTLPTGDPAQWEAMQPMIQGLLAAGVVSQSSVDAWVAMRSRTMPKWQPALDAGHIQTARAQP